MLFVEIILGNNKILLGVGYRPPQGNLVEAINLLDRTLSSLIPLYDYVLVLGDFNVNFLVDNQISHCFSSYNLHQLLLEPTRITEHSATLLDPIFLNCVDKCLKVGTVSAKTFSDHLVVYCHISMKTIKPQPKTITYRDFKNFDDNSFTEDLFSIDWLIIVYIRDIEDKIQYLVDNITWLFDKHAPIRTIVVSKPRAPWMTRVLRLMRKERNKDLYKFRKNPTTQNRAAYNQLRNLTKTATTAEKRIIYHIYQNKLIRLNFMKLLNHSEFKKLKHLTYLSAFQSLTELTTSLRAFSKIVIMRVRNQLNFVHKSHLIPNSISD
nr:unnamed protein product [Callosobruchus analis]